MTRSSAKPAKLKLASIILAGTGALVALGTAGADSRLAPAPNARLHSQVSVPLRRPPVQRRPAILAAAVPTALAAIAEKTASAYGDQTPTSAEFVATTRQRANAVDSGDRVDTDEAVFYVVLHGHFNAARGFVNPGARVPTGAILAITVDPATLDVLDLSLSDEPRDIATLGQPIPLDLNSG